MVGETSFDREAALDRARRHIFNTGVGDCANDLCKKNSKFGLAKIHFVQEKLGMDPDATFVTAPDATITRNKVRWSNGIGYGGKISWGPGDEAVIVLDTMPNACGMLIGGLEDIPEPGSLIERIHDMNRSTDHEIDGTPIKWDFAEGNHFVNVFEVKATPSGDGIDLPPYSFAVHCSAPELKKDNSSPYGFGFYAHQSPRLRELMNTYQTPFGPINLLEGSDAKDYYEFYRYVEQFAMKRRALAASVMFGDYQTVTNKNHQGLLDLNTIALGAHSTTNSTRNDLFPLTLRADLPCYLLRGNNNFTDEGIEILGFYKRAEKLGVLNRLRNANILPHGGGYQFPHMLSVNKVIETKDNIRYFVCDFGTGIGEKIFDTPRDLQFGYRGRQIVMKTLELGLGEIVARMIPKFVLKI